MRIDAGSSRVGQAAQVHVKNRIHGWTDNHKCEPEGERRVPVFFFRSRQAMFALPA